MKPLNTLSFRSIHLAPGFSNQRLHKQTATHADLPMNAPDGELNSRLLEGFPPRQHVLVDVIHKRAVQIEQEPCPASNPLAFKGRTEMKIPDAHQLRLAQRRSR